MTRKPAYADTPQRGFDDIFAEAEAAFEKECGHLPATMDEAPPYFSDLIDRHHAAMLAADLETAMALRKEAEKLALRLNGGEPGILAGPDAPGCVLANRTAAVEGTSPKWGQCGNFIIEVCTMRVRIEMDGLFGIGARYMPWMNFLRPRRRPGQAVSLRDRLSQLHGTARCTGAGPDA